MDIMPNNVVHDPFSLLISRGVHQSALEVAISSVTVGSRLRRTGRMRTSVSATSDAMFKESAFLAGPCWDLAPRLSELSRRTHVASLKVGGTLSLTLIC